MEERLTEKDSIENKRYMINSEKNIVYTTNARLNNFSTLAYCWGKPIEKLAQLEDIMEKYGIESVEELEEKLNEPERIWNANLKDLKQQVKREINKELETDRDTWKRACELACEEINSCDNYGCKTYTIPLKEMPQYFYQQAKKEGNDE